MTICKMSVAFEFYMSVLVFFAEILLHIEGSCVPAASIGGEDCTEVTKRDNKFGGFSQFVRNSWDSGSC